MTEDAPPKKRRRLRIVAAAVLVVLLLVAVGLMTGSPQHALADFAISRALNAEVSIEGLRTYGSIKVERLTLAGRSAKGSLLPPVLIVENLEIDYGVPGISPRVLSSVSADAVHLNLDARTGAESNFAFLTEGSEDPEAQALDPKWLPAHIELNRLNVTAAIRDAQSSVEGLSLRGGVPPNGNAALEITGDDVQASFAGLMETVEPTALTGDIRFAAVIDGKEVGMNANALLERAGDFDARARATLSQDWLEPGVKLQSISATLNSASLDGAALDSFFAGLTGGNFGFDTIIAEPSHIEYNVERRKELPAVEGAVLVQGLRLGTAEHPIYRGDMSISADVPGGGVSEGTLRLSLDEAHIIEARLSGTPEQGRATLTGRDWQKDKLIALIPQAAHSFVQSLDFHQASVNAEMDWSPESTSSAGSLTSPDSSQPIAEYELTMPDEENWTAAAVLRVGAGQVSVDYSGRGSESFDFKAELREIPTNNLLLAALGSDTELKARGNLTGAISVRGRPEWNYFACEGTATFAGLAVDPVSFETMTAEMQGRVTREADRAELSHIKFDAGDGITALNITDVIVNLEPFYVRTKTAAVLDLAHLARWYEEPDLYGEVEIQGLIGYADGEWGFPLTIRCVTLGYGDFVLPYRTTLHVETTVDYVPERNLAQLEGFKMYLGEGTRIVISNSEIGLEPLEFGRTYFEMNSDLSIGTGLGLFASAQGRSRLNGHVSRIDNVVRAEYQLDAGIDSVVFPEEIASAEGLVFSASGIYVEAFEGTGTLTAERVTVAGGHITDVGGGVTISDNVVSVPDLRGDVFNGRFAGRIDAHVLEAGMPIDISGRLTEFDLAVFSEQVKPPETRLTGTADATFSLRNTLDGPEDLTVFATSSQGFSMNRDLVQRVLESEAFRGALGIAQLEKTVSRFLGKASQRPFDSAEMRLNDEGERLRGTAILLSEKTEDYNGLNLTIELAIDDEALLQTLKMLQESQIENVHF